MCRDKDLDVFIDDIYQLVRICDENYMNLASPQLWLQFYIIFLRHMDKYLWTLSN